MYTPIINLVLRGFPNPIVTDHECMPILITDKGSRSVFEVLSTS